MTTALVQGTGEFERGFNEALRIFRGTDKDGTKALPVREYTAMRVVQVLLVDLAVNRVSHGVERVERAVEAANRLLDALGVEVGDPFPDNVITFAECRRRRAVSRG